MMKPLRLFLLASAIYLSACQDKTEESRGEIIGAGQMPNVVMDGSGNPQIVFGSGDSILYSSSADRGRTFSSPTLVAIVPNLAASHMRGPQIAVTTNGLVVTACNDPGDIFSFVKNESGNWSKAGRVNDVDTMAKENLMALSADGDQAFAVWLDLRDGHNKIFGSRSINGGKTWSKNILVYASPDTTVCECCKPSIIVKGNNIYLMFRNQLMGNRDLYLIHSTDGGNNFGKAEKLGIGSWALNGCPMDGGGLSLAKNGGIETVFARQGVIYSCEPGKEEKELGRGRSCTTESVNGKNVYAWVEDGNVIIRKPRGMRKNLGKGQLPQIKALNNEHILCIWENEKKIHKAVIEL
jgi:hypothetical protein